MNPQEKKPKFKLNYGIHRNTITSRDSDVTEFDTEEEARQSYLSRKEFHNSIGYLVWFAEITRPDDSKVMLEQNPCYNR